MISTLLELLFKHCTSCHIIMSRARGYGLLQPHATLPCIPHHAELVLRSTRDGTVLLRTADQVRHHLVDLTIRQVLVDAISTARQRIRQGVTHPVQLREGYEGIRWIHGILHCVHGQRDTFGIVRGTHDFDLTMLDAFLQQVPHVVIVAIMRVLDGIMDQLRGFRLHVRAAYQFRTKAVSFPLGAFHILLDAMCRVLEVALVRIVDDGKGARCIVLTLQ
mmetsp:Transcript_4199/g.10944  ORF Transcript_4199/g.10944 Transcript_4199/m.10944 type:complete len:219 (-) Transcript_4199:1408-2064(-)